MTEISNTEAKLAGVVLVLAILLGMLIEPIFTRKMEKRIETFDQALKLTDPEQFNYAAKTNVGNVLAYGELVALEPVKIEELVLEYGAISKVDERYTRHTRTVCNSYDKKGSCTSWRTEVYYTWDHWDTDTFIGSNFIFLGRKTTPYEISIPIPTRLSLTDEIVNQKFSGKYSVWYLYENNMFWSSEGDHRYYYHILPTKSNVSIFFRFFNGEVVNPFRGKLPCDVYYDVKPEQITENERKALENFPWFFYPIFILIMEGLWFWLALNIDL